MEKAERNTQILSVLHKRPVPGETLIILTARFPFAGAVLFCVLLSAPPRPFLKSLFSRYINRCSLFHDMVNLCSDLILIRENPREICMYHLFRNQVKDRNYRKPFAGVQTAFQLKRKQTILHEKPRLLLPDIHLHQVHHPIEHPNFFPLAQKDNLQEVFVIKIVSALLNPAFFCQFLWRIEKSQIPGI